MNVDIVHIYFMRRKSVADVTDDEIVCLMDDAATNGLFWSGIVGH